MSHNDADMAVIIMAGGVGTRFWPLSTEKRPKQFITLFDDRSLLQKSYDRIRTLISNEKIIVLTNRNFVEMVMDQLPEIPKENIIGEPVRRDTAAAVCLGAMLCRRRFGNPCIITLTADHLIEPIDEFQKTLLSAVRRANGGKQKALYTFGVRPTHPATGYGYLELGNKVFTDRGIEHFKVVRFKEKPDLKTAEGYMNSGRFYWNSGMFVWTADAILDEVEKHLPEHFRAISKAVDFDGTSNWQTALREAFDALKTISIDYGVMEKASETLCVASHFSWSDVGGWHAVKDFLPSDEFGNHCRGRVLHKDAGGNMVFCEDPEEVVMLVGIKDLVVVRAGRKTLIAHRDQTEEIKNIVQYMDDVAITKGY